MDHGFFFDDVVKILFDFLTPVQEIDCGILHFNTKKKCSQCVDSLSLNLLRSTCLSLTSRGERNLDSDSESVKDFLSVYQNKKRGEPREKDVTLKL